MEKLINYINRFSLLSTSELQIIKEHVYIKKFKARAFVHEAGTICKRIGFLERGVLRSFFIDTKGNELIHNFHTVNQFAVDLLSYQENTISSMYLQAITDCEIVFVSKKADEFLTINVEKWAELNRKISNAILSEKAQNRTILSHTDAKERYLAFMKKNPELMQSVPLGQIASYLGIAQQSLSRIRKELSI